MAGINGFEPQEGSPVLMSRAMFEEFIEMKAKYEAADLDIDYGATVRGTVTYCEPTIYEASPLPDPLTVGQE